MNGHAKLQANEYGAALGEYLDAHRINPDEPLVKLCISNLFTNFACDSKHCRDRSESAGSVKSFPRALSYRRFMLLIASTT